MARTHFMDWTRDDEAETDIVVEYTISPGRPAYTPRGEHAPIDPPEGAEVEVVAAYLAPPKGELLAKNAPQITLTDAEVERLVDYILENHEDDGPDEY